MFDTILVTGGAGFIGSCFVRQWLEQCAGNVVTLDKLTYAGHRESLGAALDDPRHRLVVGDVCDREAVARLLEQHRPDAVVHFAAETHVDRSIDDAEAFLQTNVVGTFRLLEEARRYWTGLSPARQSRFRMLHVSTDEVYGQLGPTGAFDENSPHAPNSPYAASKAAADHFARAAFQTHGLPVLTTNCSNNYGPCQFPEKLIPLMILNCLAGRELPIYGDGRQVRDWLFVEDHCRALRTVLQRGRPGEVYHVGGHCERANLDIVTAVCRLVDRLVDRLPVRPCESLIRRVPDRPGHDRRYALDATKIRNELGWEPAVGFDEGLEKTVRWYIDNRQWVRQVTEGLDVYRRLGLSQTVPLSQNS